MSTQDLKVFHIKNNKEYIINNQDKVIIKLKKFEYLFGKIVFSSDSTNSYIQIDNTKISKNNIEYIQFSPIAKLLNSWNCSRNYRTFGNWKWNIFMDLYFAKSRVL